MYLSLVHSAGYADEIKTMTVKSASSRELANDNVTKMNIEANVNNERTDGRPAHTNPPNNAKDACFIHSRSDNSPAQFTLPCGQ